MVIWVWACNRASPQVLDRGTPCRYSEKPRNTPFKFKWISLQLRIDKPQVLGRSGVQSRNSQATKDHCRRQWTKSQQLLVTSEPVVRGDDSARKSISHFSAERLGVSRQSPTANKDFSNLTVEVCEKQALSGNRKVTSYAQHQKQRTQRKDWWVLRSLQNSLTEKNSFQPRMNQQKIYAKAQHVPNNFRKDQERDFKNNWSDRNNL